MTLAPAGKQRASCSALARARAGTPWADVAAGEGFADELDDGEARWHPPTAGNAPAAGLGAIGQDVGRRGAA